MTILKRISILLALCACLAAAGCGADDEKGKPVPAARAAQLQAQLDIVQNRLDNGTEGACKDILSAQDANDDAVARVLDSLPSDVDPDVRDALQQSFDNLWSLVESKCEDLKPDQPTQTQTDTQPETTETPTQTETQPETTETTAPPTDTTTAPDQAPLPDDGNGDNGAVPGSGGGAGVGPGALKDKGKDTK